MKNDPLNPFAAEMFTEESARRAASEEGLPFTSEHLEVLYALWEYFTHHDETNFINTRELHDALDEKFHHKGGMKYLYSLFPGGPVAQGCRLAGLQPPAGAIDKGFGSAV